MPETLRDGSQQATVKPTISEAENFRAALLYGRLNSVNYPEGYAVSSLPAEALQEGAIGYGRVRKPEGETERAPYQGSLSMLDDDVADTVASHALFTASPGTVTE